MRGKPNLKEIETTELCSYGCGKTAKYRFGTGKVCCSTTSNKCDGMRKRNSDGIKKAYDEGRGYVKYTSDIKKRISESSKNTWNIKMKKIREETPIHLLKKGQQSKVLYEKQDGKCAKCGLNEWNGEQIVLELHHISRDKKVENIDDITLLCPNCHSQTNNWKGRNKKSMWVK